MPSERWIRKKSPKKSAKKAAPKKKAKGRDSVEPLRKGLAKRTKAELIDALVGLARGDRKILRELEKEFQVQTPADELVAVTRQAIGDATWFDERQMNYNFDYDRDAYMIVERNFGRLVKGGALEEAMQLALDLMKRGSYQVEMSDEGMMSDILEDCIDVVIEAVGKSHLPPEDIARWCDEMTEADRVKFICDQELKALRKQIGS